MKEYIKQVSNTCYRVAVILLIFTLSRLFFYIFNHTYYTGNSAWETIRLFIIGIRFDASAVIEYNLIFLLIYLVPLNFLQKKGFLKYFGITVFAINALILLLNFIDIEYFKYTAKRSTADLFAFIFLGDDVRMLLPQFLHDFWYIPLLWIITVVAGYLLYLRIPFKTIRYAKAKIGVLAGRGGVFVLIFGIFFLLVRGTGLKPLQIISAAKYTSSQNVSLLLNTPFCIIHTLDEKDLMVANYFKPDQLDSIYTPVHQYNSSRPNKVNVVIIILESFSKEFIGSLTHEKTYTPHLDSIIHNSLAFENAFANGKKSIEGIPAVLAGIPSLIDRPYITSRFSSNRLEALPAMLKKEGYNTSFFHGGRNGTMGFDMFANLAGIDKYYGLNEYDGPEAYDGTWGIYDEEFLQFFARKLNTFKQPFFSSIFTLSSHHPYKVPEKDQHLFPSDETDLERSVRYSDYALGRFFNTVKNEPWFRNTLFVMVADHTAKEEANMKDISLNMYRIPIVYYMPADTALRGLSNRITKQTDIMPSVLDFAGVNKPFVAFGNSVFRNERSEAFYYLGGIYRYIRGDDILSFDGSKILSVENWKTDKPVNKNDSLATNMANELKAIIQQYQTRLKNNRMVVTSAK